HAGQSGPAFPVESRRGPRPHPRTGSLGCQVETYCQAGRFPYTITASTFNRTVMSLLTDLKFALRSLARAKVLSATAILALALRTVLGRLLDAKAAGPNAAGAAVLTHRSWTTGLHSDPDVLGKTIRLGTRSAAIVGVLEPSVPYPAETELIANVVTSPHHLSATMVTGRQHRMTQLFGRLAPGAEVETARAELRAVHGAILQEHPEAYPVKADFRI